MHAMTMYDMDIQIEVYKILVQTDGSGSDKRMAAIKYLFYECGYMLADARDYVVRSWRTVLDHSR